MTQCDILPTAPDDETVGEGPPTTGPNSPNAWVRRPRLDTEFEAGARASLTVVTAGPGEGKTVALSQWVRFGAHPPAKWLTFEPADNNPDRFWRRLLNTVLPPSTHPPSLQERRRPSSGTAPATTDRVLTCVDLSPMLVVLDDFHVISNGDILESFARLVSHLPPSAHLVVAGRGDPPLPLHRLRMNGDLAEIRTNRLRFTRDEASSLFGITAGQVLEHQIGEIVDRTEGWAAGLKLAAVDFAEGGDPHRMLSRLTSGVLTDHYFSRTVLDGLPPDQVRFLLAISMLDGTTGELSEQLAHYPDAARLLATLARQNLFITCSDSVGLWYRLHPLFADFLRRFADREDPAIRPGSRPRGGRVVPSERRPPRLHALPRECRRERRGVRPCHLDVGAKRSPWTSPLARHTDNAGSVTERLPQKRDPSFVWGCCRPLALRAAR